MASLSRAVATIEERVASIEAAVKDAGQMNSRTMSVRPWMACVKVRVNDLMSDCAHLSSTKR